MSVGDVIGPATGAGSLVETIQTLATDAGPYVLAVFGALVAVSVGLALLGRAKKGIVSAFKG